MVPINDEPALVLHTRPYRENSQLVDLLTLHHGRVGAVFKRGRRQAGGLSVFATLRATCYGRGGLVTLKTPDEISPRWLTGQAAAAGFYMVELLVRLLREREPVPELFATVCYSLERCSAGDDLRALLRPFEWQLLDDLGYGLNLAAEAASDLPIAVERWYRFVPEFGFVSDALTDPQVAALTAGREVAYLVRGNDLLLRGNALLAIENRDFAEPQVNVAAQRLFRRCIAPLLKDRPLRSRELLQKPRTD